MECWYTPLQWLCEVAGYWQELEHAVVYADPEHPKHAQWVTSPVSMLAMQELGCFKFPGIVYISLQHGAVYNNNNNNNMLHLYSAFLRGLSPHPPPKCSIHLYDATAAIVRQNAHHTPAYWWRGDRVMKPISVWG